MIKHATSSVFVFRNSSASGWELGLVEQPRLRKLMIPGGHVEQDETQAQAALREVQEETGFLVKLLPPPAPSLPVGYPLVVMPAPWWITEIDVPKDNHLAEAHVHVDHVFLAVAESSAPVSPPAHPFAWYGQDDLDEDRMFGDTAILARQLFRKIGQIAHLSGQDTELLQVLTS